MLNRALLVLSIGLLTAFVSHAGTVRQWLPAGGGSWNTPANWSGGAVPVVGDTADFSTVNITADATVTLDGDQTVDVIVFGDTNTATAGSWIIAPGTGGTLTLAGTGVNCTVNALGTNKVARFAVPIAGTNFRKDGVGTLEVANALTYTGTTMIDAGTVRLGASTAIAPTFTGASIWLDAADAASVIKTGSAVTEWRDKSGNARHAAQATAANQPTAVTAGQNGRDVIRFDGTDDFLNIDLTFLVGVSYTVFAVEGRNSNKTESYFLGTGGTTTNQGLHFGYRDADSFTQAQNGNDLTYDNGSLTHVGTKVFRSWTMRLNTAASNEQRLFLNGSSVFSRTSTGPMSAAATGVVGRGFGGTRYYAGDLCELIIFNSSITDAERLGIQAYLSSKWNTVSLPPASAVTLATGATLDFVNTEQILGSLAGGGAIINSGGLQTGALNTNTTFTGTISGAGGLNKTGTGALLLGGSSDFAGATLVTSGALGVSADQALGTTASGTTVTGNATLFFQDVNYATPEAVTLNAGNNNGSSRLDSLGGPNTFAGTIALGCSANLGIQDKGLTLTGAISGPHNIIKQGSGTLTLQAACSYTGNTNVHAGTIRLDGGANRLPVTTTVVLGTESTGGQLDLNNQSQDLAGLFDVRAKVPATASPASPETITGLLYWLDANDASTLFQDAAGTLPVTAAGQPIGRWADKSGNARHFTQATAANQPGYVPNAFESSAAVRFDGTSDQLTLATATTPVTVFIVNRMSILAADRAGIWGSSNPADRGIRRRVLSASWGGDNNAADFDYPEKRIFINGSPSVDFGGYGNPHLLTVIQGSTVNNQNATFNNTNLGLYNSVRYFAGDIAEVVVYNRELTENERLSVESFLRGKWSVSPPSGVVDGASDLVIPELRLSVPTGETHKFSGVLGTTGKEGFAFTKQGGGVLELANTASNTGGFNVLAGTVRLADSNAAPTGLPVTNGLQQHFDASDASTFTFASTTSITATAPNMLISGGPKVWLDASSPMTVINTAGKVSQWSDISGYGLHFSQATPANQPDFVAADNRIDGSDTRQLLNTTDQVLLGATGATVFVVGRNQANLAGGGWGKFSGEGNTVQTPGRADGKILDNFASASRVDFGFVGFSANQRFLYGAVQSGTTLEAYYNALFLSRTAATFTVPTTAQQRIFGQQAGISLHEVVIFDRALSDDDRRRIELYLINKWSLSAAQTNSRVTRWTSKTGADTSKDLTPLLADSEPTRLEASSSFNNKPVVYFDGNDLIVNQQNLSTGNSTVVTVQRLTRSVNGRLVTGRANNWLMGYHGDSEDRFHPNGWVTQTSSNNAQPTAVPKIYTGINEGGVGSFYSGLTFLAGNSNGTQGPNGLSLGGYANNNNREFSRGEIAEILVYDRKLSTSELRLVNGYLQAKWLTQPTATRGALPDSGPVAISAGATLDLNDFDETVGPLSTAAGASVTLGSGTLTVNSTAASTSSGTISGSGSLVKAGTEAFTLASANTYSGATTISAGTLLITNASGSATGTSTVLVNAGGTLGGTGSTSGAVTITGGTLSPGANGPGTLTLASLAMDSASTLSADLGSSSDLIVLNGPLTLDGTVNTNPVGGFAFGRFTLIVYAGALTNNTLDVGTVPPGYTPTVEAGNNLVVLALSAPTTTVLAANPVSPTVFSQPMSFSATVAPVAPAVGTPIGSVIFKVDGVAQPAVQLVNGVATLNIASLPVGAHSIEASFAVTSTSGASSATLPHSVVAAQTTIALSSSANPSPDGSAVITALLNGVAPAVAKPTGAITFKFNGETTTVAASNGIATLPFSGLLGGVYPVEASYAGDAGFQGSSNTMNQTVTPRFTSPPTITPNPAVAGQPIVAAVDAGPNGTVTWNWGDGTSATGANASHLYTTPGSYTMTLTITLSDGTTLTATQNVFVAAGLGDDADIGGGANPPGVTGVIVGGSGVTLKQGGKGKLSVDYVNRSRTNFAGTAPLAVLALPNLTLEDVAFASGTITVGTAELPFTLDKKGRGKNTVVKSAMFNLKKKTFAFKLQRSDITDAVEAAGGTKADGKLKKTSKIYLPVRIQIGTKVFVALAYELNYTATATKGKGSLTK